MRVHWLPFRRGPNPRLNGTATAFFLLHKSLLQGGDEQTSKNIIFTKKKKFPRIALMPVCIGMHAFKARLANMPKAKLISLPVK
jgi:hypothetical protein